MVVEEEEVMAGEVALDMQNLNALSLLKQQP